MYIFYLSITNKPVIEIQNNQATIQNELKELKSECHFFLQSSDSWIGLHTTLNTAFKEMGDLVNWSNEIESDLQKLIELKKDAKKKLSEEDSQNQATTEQNYITKTPVEENLV